MAGGGGLGAVAYSGGIGRPGAFRVQGCRLARGAGSRVPARADLEVSGQTGLRRLQVVGGITGLPGRNAIRACAQLSTIQEDCRKVSFVIVLVSITITI